MKQIEQKFDQIFDCQIRSGVGRARRIQVRDPVLLRRVGDFDPAQQVKNFPASAFEDVALERPHVLVGFEAEAEMPKLDRENGDEPRRDGGRRRVHVPAKTGQKRVFEDGRFFGVCRRRRELGDGAAQKDVEPFRLVVLANVRPQGQPEVVRPDGLQIDACALSSLVFAAAAAAFCRRVAGMVLVMLRRFLPFWHSAVGLDEWPARVKRASVFETRSPQRPSTSKNFRSDKS